MINNLFYIEMIRKYCNKNFKMKETNQKTEKAEQISLILDPPTHMVSRMPNSNY